jgi:hypothetical protein
MKKKGGEKDREKGRRKDREKGGTGHGGKWDKPLLYSEREMAQRG